MKILIKTTQLELTSALRTYVIDKFSSVEKLIKSLETMGELILKIELARSTKHHNKGNVYYVECTMPVMKKVIRIEQYDKDMRAAIDKAQRRLKIETDQLKDKIKHKDKKVIEQLRNK